MQPITIEVRSLSDLISRLDELTKETNLRWWFRGHRSLEWELLPSVRRGYTAEQERFLFNEFYVRAKSRHDQCPSPEDIAGWLTLMRHYGLPTRLLDWSFSPLVAAFFASEACHRHYLYLREKATDACIWALAPTALNESQGFEPLLYPLDAYSFESLLAPSKRERQETGKTAAAMTIEIDPRIQVQQGAFTLHGTPVALNKLENSHEWLRCFYLPASTLPQIARELELLGIRLAGLFPDLASLARELVGVHRPSLP